MAVEDYVQNLINIIVEVQHKTGKIVEEVTLDAHSGKVTYIKFFVKT